MRNRPDDPKRCQEHVPDSTGWGFPQCSRRWTVEEDGGKWCKQHSPSAVKARQKKAEETWNQNHAERMWPYREVERLGIITTQLLAYAEHDCFGCNERGRCEEADELRRVAIESAVVNRDPV